MQLKYNRQPSLGSSIFKILVKLLLLIVVVIFGIFLIEKISFPSPEKKYQIDVTNEIKKL
jgi:flagellar biogenesis protein FliO